MHLKPSSGIRSILAVAFVVGAMGGAIGCRPDISELGVPLQYAPTTDANTGSFTLPLHPAKVYVAPVVDDRDNKEAIGANEEDAKHIPILAQTTTPAQFVHDGIVSQLKSDGVQVVDTPDQADRVLTLTLLRFWAVEDPNYHAAVQVTVNLTDKTGANTLWTGGANGEDSTFGRSLNADNYQQVLSNSVSKLANSLVTRPDFTKALSAE